jgi:hypothetical protein
MTRARFGAIASRRARSSLASLVGLCLGACLLVAVAPPAQANAALTPTSVTLGAGHVDVAGLAVAHVTVDVAATVDTFFFGPTDPLVVRLVRTSPQPDESSPRYLWVLLPRTGGTDAAHGTWAGSLAVPSTANGAWRVDRVSNYIFTSGADPAPIETDPRSVGLPDSVLTVTGTHRPVLTLVQTPIVPLPRPRGALTFRFTGTARWSDRGRPVAGLAVTFDTDDHCLESTPPNRVTNASGVFTGSYSGVGIFCVTTPLPGTAADQLASSYYQRVVGSPLAAMRVSARLTASTIRLGEPASVTGTVVGLYPALSLNRPRVLLQKLVGRTWRTVNSTTVRASGRYTLDLRPGTRGIAVYRVFLPTQRPYYRVVTPSLRLHVN